MASESAPRAITHRIEVILLGGLARGPATRLKRPLLAEFVFAVDRGLQRLQGIFEYTHKPDCFFRISFNRLRTGVVLSDVRLADPVTGWWSCTSGTSGFPSYPQKALPWHGDVNSTDASRNPFANWLNF